MSKIQKGNIRKRLKMTNVAESENYKNVIVLQDMMSSGLGRMKLILINDQFQIEGFPLISHASEGAN
jgi:hypothetical protein